MWGQQQNRAFWETSAGRQILTLDLILRKISEAQRTFVDTATRRGITLACPPACGSCCHGFMPDVLPVEAEYIAYYILSASPALPASSPNLTTPPAPETMLSLKPPENPSPCPFHDPSRPGANCRVYPARPLICRLFGHSSTRAKTGETLFRLCRHMPTPDGFTSRILDSQSLANTIGAEPPLMSDFAMELLAIDPSSASDRRPLAEAMPPALARISSILHYCPDEPEPNAA